MNLICIDIEGKSAKTLIKRRLEAMKATESVEDCGEYHFPQPTGWFKLMLTTKKSHGEVDDWLYNLRLPFHFNYATC